MVRLPGGSFLMGGDDPDKNVVDGEGPVREVILSPYRLGRTPVTNRQFQQFVEATGYRTGAERIGWSFVFHLFVDEETRKRTQRVRGAPWWCVVEGASWWSPEGPGSTLEDRWLHPVTHVDHMDALAFCSWAGVRLPTEAEWEAGARGGLVQARFPWGDELTPDGVHQCNIWQGTFPTVNTRDDGYIGTSPVATYPPNGYGLHDVAGNVWEWCGDWFTNRHAAERSSNPPGPARGTEKVMRGGSHMCHDSYCNRYRVAARSKNDPDSSSGNLGFRIAADDATG
ncbi:serine/threonine protein phosphatase [Pseudoclavibacter sp. RFBB5]|nr:serine/threonine protein phosphatase [Pseudoclavibacter sp. RFBB5]